MLCSSPVHEATFLGGSKRRQRSLRARFSTLPPASIFYREISHRRIWSPATIRPKGASADRRVQEARWTESFFSLFPHVVRKVTFLQEPRIGLCCARCSLAAHRPISDRPMGAPCLADPVGHLPFSSTRRATERLDGQTSSSLAKRVATTRAIRTPLTPCVTCPPAEYISVRLRLSPNIPGRHLTLSPFDASSRQLSPIRQSPRPRSRRGLISQVPAPIVPQPRPPCTPQHTATTSCIRHPSPLRACTNPPQSMPAAAPTNSTAKPYLTSFINHADLGLAYEPAAHFTKLCRRIDIVVPTQYYAGAPDVIVILLFPFLALGPHPYQRRNSLDPICKQKRHLTGLPRGASRSVDSFHVPRRARMPAVAFRFILVAPFSVGPPTVISKF